MPRARSAAAGRHVARAALAEELVGGVGQLPVPPGHRRPVLIEAGLEPRLAVACLPINHPDQQRVSGRGALVDQVAAEPFRHRAAPDAIPEELEGQDHLVPVTQPHSNGPSDLALLDLEEAEPERVARFVRVDQRVVRWLLLRQRQPKKAALYQLRQIAVAAVAKADQLLRLRQRAPDRRFRLPGGNRTASVHLVKQLCKCQGPSGRSQHFVHQVRVARLALIRHAYLPSGYSVQAYTEKTPRRRNGRHTRSNAS